MNHCLLFSVTDKLKSRSSGVHRIANHLRTHQEWDVEVIDFFYSWTLDELKELVRSRVTDNTRFFGFSFLFLTKHIQNNITPFCEWARENYPNIVFISGGQGDQIYNNMIDYHVGGYGEYALDTLLAYLFSNGPKPVFQLNTNTKNKTRTRVINALANYPAYPMHDPMIKYEARDFIMPGEWGRIEFSRGCKFKCKFCSFPVLGVQEDYTRHADSAREQLMHAYDNWGIEDYLVSDETFNDRTEKITKFANMVETLPWRPYFGGYVRADLLVSRPADRHELLRMGLFSQFYGIESFNQQTSKFVGKGMNVEKLQAGLIDVKNFFKANSPKNYFAGSIAVIAGLPYETLETLDSTYKWIRQNWSDQVIIASALEISQHLHYRHSDIDKNYLKYGYREMQGLQDLNLSIQDVNFLIGNNDHVIWENDHMNFVQALEWVKKMTSMKTFGGQDYQRLGMGTISSTICDENGNPVNRERKVSLSRADGIHKYWNVFLESYKRKKLSL